MSTKPTPYTPGEATARIRYIATHGAILPTSHCARDSMPKRGVTSADLLSCLTGGQVVRQAEWSDDHNNWKYRVEGQDLDTDELTAIAVIIEEDLTVIVITVF